MSSFRAMKKCCFVIIAFLCVSCVRPSLIIPDTLETHLRYSSSYHHYVKLVNRAMDKDTSALKELLMINNIGDAAGYEHGDILIQLLENLGDDMYSNVLSTVPTTQKIILQDYFCVGMDIRKREYRFRIDKKYPKTFNELEFDEEREKLMISICQ